MTEHSFFMERAISLAKHGIGFVNPNPLVGAVIVQNGQIIGEGWHAKYGDLHAERNALCSCTCSPKGATLYVTLEPCCHHGKQPPCTDAILKSGISKVYIGSRDPNPLVSGKGLQLLREHGITVITDFMREQCDALNPIFFRYIKTKMPYTIVKYAMTADGKIACANGASHWVTGDIARMHVHKTRKRVAGICVGIGTVLTDNPMLNCRCDNPSNPVRIVLDTHLQIPLDSKLVQSAKQIPVWVCCNTPDPKKKAALEAMGVTILEIPKEGKHLSISAVLALLGEKGIDSVLVEGGAAIHKAVLQEGYADLIQVYIAPKIFGGDGLSPVGAMGITNPIESVQLSAPHITPLGEDILLEFQRKESM